MRADYIHGRRSAVRSSSDMHRMLDRPVWLDRALYRNENGPRYLHSSSFPVIRSHPKLPRWAFRFESPPAYAIDASSECLNSCPAGAGRRTAPVSCSTRHCCFAIRRPVTFSRPCATNVANLLSGICSRIARATVSAPNGAVLRPLGQQPLETGCECIFDATFSGASVVIEAAPL